MKGIYTKALCKIIALFCLSIFFLYPNHMSAQTATMYYKDINITLKGGIIVSIKGSATSNGHLKHDGNDMSTNGITTLDDATIKLEGNIIQDGSSPMFGIGDRTHIVFENSNDKFITGSNGGLLSFHELSLTDDCQVTLERDIEVYDNLNLTDGNINANDFNLFFTLDPTENSGNPRSFGDPGFYPDLFNEDDANRIINGNLFVDGNITSGYSNFPQEYGGLGIELTSMGLTHISIKRSYPVEVISGTQSGIGRWFNVKSNAPLFTSQNIVFEYVEEELIPASVADENNLVFFRHFLNGSDNLDPNDSWNNFGANQIDPITNMGQLLGIDTVFTSRWTLAECNNPLINVNSGSSDTVCVDDLVTLDAGSNIGWSYLWNTGATTQTIDVTNSTAMTETFVVTVTNSELCFASDSLKVTWENYPVVTITEDTSYVCAGENYTISPTYGGSDLTYAWSSGETTPDIEHTSDGTQTILYIITVTNPTGCQRSDSILIIDHPEVLVDLGMDTTNCDGGPITLDAFNPGNQNTTTYIWSNSSTTSMTSVTSTGFYSVTVSDVVTSCTNSDEIFVGISDIQITLDSISHPDCNGGPTGDIYLTITNPEPMTNYLWSNGDVTEDIDFVTADSYNITVTDVLGCSDSLIGIMLIDPPAIVSNPIIEDDTCGFGVGSIISNISGGSPGYMYEWFQFQFPLPNPNVQDQMGLKAGFYELIVLDSKNCSGYFTYDVLGAMDTLMITEQNIVHETCTGDTDGSININVSGGNFVYSYLWSNGESTEDISGLGAGIYTVQVTDIEGCITEKSFEITAPETPTVQIDQIELAVCEASNGSISITIIDGGLNYQSIVWSNGDTTEDITNLIAGDYMYTITYAANCTASDIITVASTEAIVSSPVVNDDECNDAMGSIFTNASGGTGTLEYLWSTVETTPNLIDIAKGDYSVTITDVVGCELINMYTVASPDTLKINPVEVDVTCFGGMDGSITLNASGGTPDLTYNWSNGTTTPDLLALVAGTYDVTVTDANLCSITSSFTIDEPTEIMVTEFIINVDCADASTGSIDLTTSGGSPTYKFLWSDNSTNEDLVNVVAGMYTVAITDDVLCTKTFDFTITEPSLLNINPLVVHDDCNMMEGSIQSNPSGGSLPWNFTWSNGAGTQDIANLAAGEYTITLEDNNGCQLIETFEVTAPDTLKITAQLTNVLCKGNLNGEIDLSIIGGNPDFDIIWSNGATTEDLSDLAAGEYTVTITDLTNCEVTASYIISEPDELSIFEILENPSAPEASDGTISIALLGGTEPYSYEWSSGQFSATITNLTAGSYTVTVTDDNGCILEETYVLNDPSMLAVEGIEFNTTCSYLEDGEVDITALNGSGNYSYAWSNGEINEDLKDLSMGSYTVTVTDNENGTTVSMTFTIDSPDPIMISEIKINPNCFGENSGSINLTISGGTETYTFEWSNGATSEDLISIPKGTYSVTVTDINGCEDIANFELIQPAEIEIAGTITSTSTTTDFDGAIDVEVEGGTMPYSYSWSSGQISQDIMNLGIGEYIIEVTDDNGCLAIDSFDVNETEMIVIELLGTDVTCFGGADGSVVSSVDGGQEPYTYEWNNTQTSENLEMLVAGEYSLTITDNNGLTGEAMITIGQPDELIDNEMIVTISCFGASDGSITISPEGGSPGYTYLWSDGSTEDMLNGLDIGEYSLTITDNIGCESTFMYTMNQPSELELIATISNPSEAGDDGAIDIFTSGGTEPYDYLWNDGIMEEDRSGLGVGTYGVTVTDANGCEAIGNFELIVEEFNVQVNITDVSCFGLSDGSINLEVIGGGVSPYTYAWDNGENTQDISNLVSGSYEVTVTDDLGTMGTYTYIVDEPDSISFTAIVIDPLCNGSNNGSIDLTILGGNDLSSITWSNGESTEDLNLLGAGDYEVIVVDVNDCIGSVSYTLEEPEILTATYEKSNVPCDGSPIGMIEMMVTGGTMPYTYMWSNGAFSNVLTNLDAGIYGVTLTDDNGCLLIDQVEIEEDIVFSVSSEIEDVTCFNAADGNIALTVSNATNPISYEWFDGSTSATISGLDVGNYFVTITDGTGCELVTSYSITEPTAMTLNLVTINAGCSGPGEGQVFTSIEGGSAPYTYAWSNGSTSEDIEDAVMGDYTVTVTDASGCTVSATANILDSPEAFFIRFLARSPINSEETIDFVDVSFPKPNTWNWDFGDNIGTSTEEDPQYTYGNDPANPISYYPVTLTASTPFCLGIKTKDIQVFNGKLFGPIEEEEEIKYTKIESLNVYPNPTNNFINVDIILNQRDLTYIDIFDMEGRRVNTFKVEGNSIYNKRLQVDHLRTGMYIILVRSGKDRKASKIVVID